MTIIRGTLRLILVLVLLAFTGCSQAAHARPAAWDVIDAFQAAGLDAENVAPTRRNPARPVPHSYRDALRFTIPTTDLEGQVFVCDTRAQCAELAAYFRAIQTLVGPYVYRSTTGVVVVQLPRGLAPETAAKYQAVVAQFAG